jgi:hypothetical protein
MAGFRDGRPPRLLMAVRGAVADVLTGCAGPIPATKTRERPTEEAPGCVVDGRAVVDCSQTWTAASRVLSRWPFSCARIVTVALPVASVRICYAVPGTGTGGFHSFALPVTAMG